MSLLDYRVVKWDEILERDWMKLLKSIPVGEYVEDLPFEVALGAVRLGIPYLAEPSSLDLLYDEPFVILRMTFEKRLIAGDMFVWKRIE